MIGASLANAISSQWNSLHCIFLVSAKSCESTTEKSLGSVGKCARRSAPSPSMKELKTRPANRDAENWPGKLRPLSMR